MDQRPAPPPELMPYVGYKQSGFGRELGPDALDACTHQKN
ncbi:aldehyde dehydrogenase family protein [Nocardia testacea]